MEIPANHPFASNEKLDATQEAERKKKIIDANSPRRRTRPAAPKQSREKNSREKKKVGGLEVLWVNQAFVIV